MPAPVLTKADMMRRLAAGEFGNTNRQWTDLHRWLLDPDGYHSKHPMWGVRHTRLAGHPACRLNLHRDDVRPHVWEAFVRADYGISPMIGQFRTVVWEGDVCRDPDGPGLLALGHSAPKDGTWREHMRKPGVWKGSAARRLLETVLNGNSQDDLEILLDAYPDHVVELSALDSAFGTVPGRNAIVWEVRRY